LCISDFATICGELKIVIMYNSGSVSGHVPRPANLNRLSTWQTLLLIAFQPTDVWHRSQLYLWS